MTHARSQRRKLVSRWTPTTKVAALANSTLLDTLRGAELAVYIKLLGATHEQKSRRVQVINSALCRDQRTAVRALRDLEDHGLITVHHDPSSRFGRTIEVH